MDPNDSISDIHPAPTIQWRGVLALCLVYVGKLREAPTSYYPNGSHYVGLYVLLAVSVGAGVWAARSAGRVDRILGTAVAVVGGVLCLQTAWDCLKIILR